MASTDGGGRVPISVIKARQNKIVKFRATLAKKPHSDKPTGKYPLWTSMTKYAYTRAMSRAECMLVSARGLNWKTVFLVMFTVYVDDSGTDPNQKLAVATALIIPAKQIPAMEREWSNLKTKEHFSRFHMAEFVARNPKSEFANWDDKKHQRVFDRVRQITNKYGVRGFSFTVNKRDYDDIVIGDWRACFGKHHYTWALRHALGFAYDWRNERQIPPLEYVFDWMGKPSDPRRKEVEEIMELAESLALKNGKSAGEFMNYSFRSLKDIAGLQCVDMAGCPIMLDGEISRLHHNLCIPSCGRRNKTSNPEGNGC